MSRARDIADLQSGAIINEAGADLDFRIESDDNANMFFVDGGNDTVAIGTSSTNAYSSADNLVVGTGSGHNGMTIFSGNANQGTIFFADALGGDSDASTYDGYIIYDHDSSSRHFRFGTAATERMRIDGSGNVGIGTTSPSVPLSVQADSNAEAILVLGRSADDIGAIAFRENDNSTALGELQYRQGYGILRHRVGYLSFETGGVTERMRIDSSGNVGINTTSPSRKLDIVGNSTYYPLSLDSTNTDYALEFKRNGSSEWWLKASSSVFQIHENGVGDHLTILASNGNVGLGTTSPATSYGKVLQIHDTGTSGANLRLTDSNSGSGTGNGLELIQIGSAAYVFNRESGAMQFGTSGTERMRISSSGDVSIGTSVSPPVGLTITADEDYHGVNLTRLADSGNPSDDEELGSYAFNSNAEASNSLQTAEAKIVARASQDHSGSVAGTDLEFYIKPNGTGPGSAPTKVHCMDNARNSYWGAFVAGNITAGNSSGFYFDHAGTMRSSRATSSNSLHWYIYNSNGNVGSVSTNGSSTSYNTSSDYRLKENIVTDWDATSRLKQLKPSRFNFKADKDTTVDGFLAHEVSSIVPEAITGTKDETIDLGTIKNKDGNIVEEDAPESKADKGEGQTWTKTKTENVYQSIDQAKLVPLLVKTIQELEARIAKLEGG